MAFQGETSKIGFTNNGNFLMTLELIAQFDQFMADHLQQYGNPGKVYTSYVSNSIYEELIQCQKKYYQQSFKKLRFFIIFL